MGNIQLYNLSKVMTHRGSIPDKLGEKQNDIFEFDVMADLFSDVIAFNFYEKMISDWRSGGQTTEATKLSYAFPHDNYSMEQY